MKKTCFLLFVLLFAGLATKRAEAQLYYTAKPWVWDSAIYPNQLYVQQADGVYFVYGPFVRRVVRPGKVFVVAPQVTAKPHQPRLVAYSVAVRPFWKSKNQATVVQRRVLFQR